MAGLEKIETILDIYWKIRNKQTSRSSQAHVGDKNRVTQSFLTFSFSTIKFLFHVRSWESESCQYIFIFNMVHFKVHYWFGEMRIRTGDILLLCDLGDSSLQRRYRLAICPSFHETLLAVSQDKSRDLPRESNCFLTLTVSWWRGEHSMWVRSFGLWAVKDDSENVALEN